MKKDALEQVLEGIRKEWMLITAGNREKCNTMTASWGGFGILWNKPVATIYVRPQRYTYEFLEREERFTLSFLPEAHRAALQLCGSKSGRDLDKIAAAGLTTAFSQDGAPYLKEATLVLVCRKLYYQDITPDHFLDDGIQENYPNRDYHRMYLGEIQEILPKGD